MRILDLFAGIGGFSLAAHWTGWETAAFVEWDGFCQKVLAKNFSGVPIYGDIKDFHYEQEKERIGRIDLICGGFPCQPFSHAGKRNGTADDRYLWPEMLRVIREVKPAWVVGENVAGLLSMDGGAVFEQVCTSLEAEGYAVEAFVLPAISRGAPHRRDRVWIVAHANGQSGKTTRSTTRIFECDNGQTFSKNTRWQKEGQPTFANPTSEQEYAAAAGGFQPEFGIGSGTITANPNKSGLPLAVRRQFRGVPYKNGTSERSESCGATPENKQWQEHWYEAATRTCRVHNGLPRRVDRHRAKRLKALGNAIVPQIAYEIFQAIKATCLPA